MPALSFDGVLVIALVAVAVPVVHGLLPRLPVPGAVLEVLAGILIGPSVLGWVHLDAPVQVLSDLGLGMLLFLAGLEIDVGGLRGPLGRLASWAFGGSILLGLACGYVLTVAGVRAKPVFLAVVLTSTAAGLLLPLLKDAGLHRAPFGQLVMAAAALAELIPVVLLSLLFFPPLAVKLLSGPASLGRAEPEALLEQAGQDDAQGRDGLRSVTAAVVLEDDRPRLGVVHDVVDDFCDAGQ
jgi:Kef-type K+ transport system membrane component KefB